VVTYTVVISTENLDGRLKPYMTANVDFEIEHHDNVLRVPNSALRWQPAPAQVAPEARGEFMKSLRAQSGAPGTGASQEAKKKDTHHRGRVWVEVGQFVRPLKVRIGLSDGTMTEIVGGELKEGTPVVVGEMHAEPAERTNNPFTPQMFRGKS
jgi:HlyD family secretion protein